MWRYKNVPYVGMVTLPTYDSNIYLYGYTYTYIPSSYTIYVNGPPFSNNLIGGGVQHIEIKMETGNDK